jgi:hypothetical protein
MANPGQVLSMLCPNTEYSLIGENYEDINWFGKAPKISKEQYEAGFSQYDTWKAEQDLQAAAKKSAAEAKLAALGLTAEDLKALGL